MIFFRRFMFLGPVAALHFLCSSPTAAWGAEAIEFEVTAVYPHDTGAFTQGLLLYNGFLYESTGLEGQSSLRKVVVNTGEVTQEIKLAENYFAEGLARVDQQLFQITWTDGIAFVYDLNTFELKQQFQYQGEGWGLCYDGSVLVMSDGSDTLTFRDPSTFEAKGVVQVTLDGSPLDRLNELECVGNDVYANVWQTDQIVRIDKQTGIVTGVIDASGLLTEEEALPADVLNGIAYDPGQNRFLITGKRWPKLFEVELKGEIDTDTDSSTDDEQETDEDAGPDADVDAGPGEDNATGACTCQTLGFTASNFTLFEFLKAQFHLNPQR